VNDINITFCKTGFKYSDRLYLDYLTLVKEKEEWKIVTKTFIKN